MSDRKQPRSPHPEQDGLRESADTERYESPSIHDLPAHEGPAVTAAGDSPPPLAAEWRH